MSHINIEKQKEALSRLRNELVELNRRYDGLKEAAGIKPEDTIAVDEGAIPPEVKAAMETAREEAAEAGRRAVASLEASTLEGETVAARRPRRGAIAV